MNKIIEDLNWRYACKKFDSTKKISKEDLDTLLEALVLTPSSYGMQPWEFVVVESKNKRAELVSASFGQEQVVDASHLIVLCIKDNIDENLVNAYLDDISSKRSIPLESLDGFKQMMMNVVNKEFTSKEVWAKNQVYIALGNLMNVCAQMRIDSCPMEGFSPKKYNEILDLSSMGLKAALVCPIGYRSEEDSYSGLKKIRFNKDKLVKFIP